MEENDDYRCQKRRIIIRAVMKFHHSSYFRFGFNYSAAGAETGHTPAHAPHSMQESASITYLPSPAEIQETGHSASQAPQLMHSSEIT